MEQKKNEKHVKLIEKTWFWKYILDNKFVSILLLYCLLFNDFCFYKNSASFTPLELIFYSRTTCYFWDSFIIL